MCVHDNESVCVFFMCICYIHFQVAFLAAELKRGDLTHKKVTHTHIYIYICIHMRARVCVCVCVNLCLCR
jgi:hypothetical protein